LDAGTVVSTFFILPAWLISEVSVAAYVRTGSWMRYDSNALVFSVDTVRFFAQSLAVSTELSVDT
jgi:hypothetical protein